MKLASLSLALVGGLLALPACDKKKDLPPAANSDPATGGYQGSKAGPPGGMQPSGGPDTQLAAARSQSSNYLKQIGIALHNAHDVHTGLPVGIFAKDGRTLGLSWRVAILPYIEQNPLYAQFKLDEPWDSENNKKLIPMIPKLYVTSASAPAGHTHYRGFTGANMMFAPPKVNGKPGQVAPGVKFSQVPDGLANTAMVVEAGEAVPWTKPDTFDIDPKNPLAAVGGVFEVGFHALRGDGSPVFVKKTITADVLRNFAVINDGYVVELPQ